MFKLRVLSSYLGTGLVIATGIAVNLVSLPQARAQTNLNLQTQLNILSPPPLTVIFPGVTPQGIDIKTERLLTLKDGTCVSSTSPQAQKFVEQQRAIGTRKGLAAEELDKSGSPKKYMDYLRDFIAAEQNRAKLRAGGPKLPPLRFGCDNQLSLAQLSLQLNPTYETNILKMGNNSSSGQSVGFGGTFLATGPGLRSLDLIALSGSEASARYSPNSSPSVDAISSYAAYQMFLHADGYVQVNNQPKQPPTYSSNIGENFDNSKATVVSGMTTIDTLTLAVQNQTAFSPTFLAEKTDFLTPQFTLSKQNINLDGQNPKACVNVTGSSSFCDFASLSLTVGQSFADVVTQENVNAAGTVAIGRKFDQTDWSLSLQATATTKHYEHFVGGRDDLLLQVGPALSYSAPSFAMFNDAFKGIIDTGQVSFSLPVTYYKNYSTVSAAVWSGWIIMPTLTVAFCSGCPAPK
jgi:hypothetical protein